MTVGDGANFAVNRVIFVVANFIYGAGQVWILVKAVAWG